MGGKRGCDSGVVRTGGGGARGKLICIVADPFGGHMTVSLMLGNLVTLLQKVIFRGNVAVPCFETEIWFISIGFAFIKIPARKIIVRAWLYIRREVIYRRDSCLDCS